MPSAREVKKRIRSVKNISQIARALEAEAATKVRRSQARALASRAYAEKAWEILLNVQDATQGGGGPAHPLLEEREEINTIMIVLITSDRGLAGAYNANIIRVAQRFAQRMDKPVKWITVGKKGRDSMVRIGANVIAEFTGMPAKPSVSDISPIARIAIDEFLSGEVDDVFIAYTDFINTLTQRPTVLPWLPLVPHQIEDTVAGEYVKDVPAVTGGSADYEFEPSPEAILQEIVPRFTELQLYQALLEAQASEHSARMVAMRSASDNASQLVDDLTLVYNKARQSAITAEILDIVGGAEALSASIETTARDIERQMPVINQTFEQRPPATTNAPDDLTRIEGIGPKMAQALIDAGIATYVQLSQTDEAQIKAAIEASGLRFAPSVPTWPKQAALAARGDWDGLAAYQDQLEGGREK